MVASVPVLTCHVTAVMGLAMDAQTTGSQEASFLRLLGERGEKMGGQGLMISREVKESAFRCTLSDGSRFSCVIEMKLSRLKGRIQGLLKNILYC